MHIAPQPIKLIAIDIDGTLLTPQKHITTRTRAAIKAAQAVGIVVTLATARRYSNSQQFADELGLAIPLITCDGALIIHHPHKEVTHTHRLPTTIAQQAIDIIARHNVQPIVHHIEGSKEVTWSGLQEFDNLELALYFSLFPEVARMPHTTLCIKQPDPLRVVAFASEEAIQHIIADVSTLPCSWNTLKRGSYECAEISIMHQTCSKATGVTALAQQLHIPLTQVMAIGDNSNDIEMLQAVGWGVAMGQAPEPVKAVAHAITTTNTDDGVARAIERYALLLDTPTASNSFKRATCL